MQMADVGWEKAKAETIDNSFAETGSSKRKQADALLDIDDLFKDLQHQLDKVASHTFEFSLNGATAKDVVSVNDIFNTIELIKNDEEIISDVLEEEN